MAGNTIVLKPASATMGCGIEIEKAFSRSGVPDGVFQTIVGGDKFDQALIAAERDGNRMVASVRSILK